ncbi:sodium/iodide co-transporter [Bacteroides pyogenes JCM 6292]|nr:sodium/iodide co-transporter [Bacteroides pyogenes JCM 6292]
MSPLSVIITIAVYFIVLFAISYVTGKKADNAGFFTGNRQSSWYVVAFA